MKNLLSLGVILATLLGTQVEVEAARRDRNNCRITGTCSNGNSRARADRTRDRARRDGINTRDTRRNRHDRVVTTTRRDRRNDHTTVNRRNHRTDRDYGDYRRNDSDRVYRSYRHRPDRTYRSHTRRYRNTRDYYRTVNRSYIYRNNWIRVHVGFDNGYRYYDDYPFFIYNGYRHRYSHVDTCDYELVDSYTGRVERTFYSYTCSNGYDMCADRRDDLNDYEWSNRYFCAERFSDYSVDTYYGDDYYSDTYYEDDYYY